MSNRFGPAAPNPDRRRQQWARASRGPAGLLAALPTRPRSTAPRGAAGNRSRADGIKHRGVDGCACPALRRRWHDSLSVVNVPRRCRGPRPHYAGDVDVRVHSDSTAVIGPLAAREPHSWDLCVGHAGRITTLRGWNRASMLAAAQPPRRGRPAAPGGRGSARGGPKRGAPASSRRKWRATAWFDDFPAAATGAPTGGGCAARALGPGAGADYHGCCPTPPTSSSPMLFEYRFGPRRSRADRLATRVAENLRSWFYVLARRGCGPRYHSLRRTRGLVGKDRRVAGYRSRRRIRAAGWTEDARPVIGHDMRDSSPSLAGRCGRG